MALLLELKIQGWFMGCLGLVRVCLGMVQGLFRDCLGTVCLGFIQGWFRLYLHQGCGLGFIYGGFRMFQGLLVVSLMFNYLGFLKVYFMVALRFIQSLFRVCLEFLGFRQVSWIQCDGVGPLFLKPPTSPGLHLSLRNGPTH